MAEQSLNNGKNRKTRVVWAGSVQIGGGNPIVVQSMAATKTTDIDATVAQINSLYTAGAGLIRIAVDSKKDVEALASIRQQTDANLVVDLQENYRLAELVAPYVQKLRYNPGHLHHHQTNIPVKDKVKFLADTAGTHKLALRIGVNFGSLDPKLKESGEDSKEVALRSAFEHAAILEDLGFKNFVVSLKSSHPRAVVEINKRFAEERSDVPLHLGVTEAGLLPDGEIKTRIAFEQLLSMGIGDTVRVSLTLPDSEKYREVEIGRRIVDDVAAGRFRSVPEGLGNGLNVISCPSCSRVENAAFVELAMKVKEVTERYKDKKLTIAVMGCRVNGPGETDDADLGLWCAPNFVNMKRGTKKIGAFKYDDVVPRLVEEIEELLASRN
jgi:(E)-4-hydroxy-3-methylbut-2-enyl-diphosphate synthase